MQTRMTQTNGTNGVNGANGHAPSKTVACIERENAYAAHNCPLASPCLPARA
jgi:hypothetical protein